MKLENLLPVSSLVNNLSAFKFIILIICFLVWFPSHNQEYLNLIALNIN